MQSLTCRNGSGFRPETVPGRAGQGSTAEAARKLAGLGAGTETANHDKTVIAWPGKLLLWVVASLNRDSFPPVKRRRAGLGSARVYLYRGSYHRQYSGGGRPNPARVPAVPATTDCQKYLPGRLAV